MFALNNILYRYAGQPVLQLADWQGAAGSQHLVLGKSGSGKTTLLHLMAGLLRPQQGSIQVANQPLHELTAPQLEHLRGATVALVPQKLHLIAALNVLDNLRLAQYYAGIRPEKARILELLQQLGLQAYAQRYPHQLSQGQAQRVVIARAVLNRPQVLLADEPTAHLDAQNCEQVAQVLIEQAQQCQATLVIATHDIRLQGLFTEELQLQAPVQAAEVSA